MKTYLMQLYPVTLKRRLAAAVLSLVLTVPTAFAQKIIKDVTLTTSQEIYYPGIIIIKPNTVISPTAGQSIRIYTSSGPVCATLAANPSANQNYITTFVPRQALNAIDNNVTNCQVMQNVAYFDGLGRPLQTVQVKGNPSGTRDVIQPFVYDTYGKESKKLLPYTTETTTPGTYRAGALTGEQSDFYSQSGLGYKNTDYPFSQTVIERSPLNRLLEQGAPGSGWQPYNTAISNSGHTIRTEYRSNAASGSYSVRKYKADAAAGSVERELSSTENYAAGELYLTVLKDENWKETDGLAGQAHEYKDKEGRIICKRVFNNNNGSIEMLSTHYVYDKYGNLCFVLTPKSGADSGTPGQSTQDQLCYQYRYDVGNRQVLKRLPGKGWEEMIYNKLDQIVFTQDAVQAGNQQRSFIKYDAQGRVIMTGVETGHTLSREQVQEIVDNHAGPLWETPDPSQSSGFFGYTNNAVPANTNTMKPMVVNFYDDYRMIDTRPFGEPTGNQSVHTTGLLTGSLVKTLDDVNGNTRYWTAFYYDHKGRVVQSKSQNHLGGTDLMNNTYNEITGELLTTNRVHTGSGSNAVTITNRYTYDHMGRKLDTYQKMNSDDSVLLSRLEYNEVGQLKNKSLGNGLQAIQYAYNERGWMKSMSAPLFNMELRYQDALNGVAEQWNGNISNQVYTNGNSNTFNYTYDKLNRLLKGSATGMSEELQYDMMGNITSLKRDGTSRDYTYYNGGLSNQLKAVANLTTVDYVYDGNGNVTTDGRLDKTITYNVLNLPQTITKGGTNVTYLYDATGRKLRKTSSGSTTDYVGGIQYKADGTIEFVRTEEGLAKRSGSSYAYYYDLKDHLGNVRTTFYRNPNNGRIDTLQRDNYYAFGLRKIGTVTGNNKYLYNGKELQDETEQYDYGARFYDPTIARWISVDPLAEKGRRWSPYNYTFNDPIRFTDPDGMWPDENNDDAGGPPSSGDFANALAIDILSVKHSLYNIFLRPFTNKEATFVKSKDGEYWETGFVKANNGLAKGTALFALDFLNVLSFGKGEGVFLAETNAKASVSNLANKVIKQMDRFGDVANLNFGDSKTGLLHILQRHSVDGFNNIPKGDLFPSGTTPKEIVNAINDVYTKGTRVSDPKRVMQTFEKRIKIHGESDNYRLIIDTKKENVVTFFKIGGLN